DGSADLQVLAGGTYTQPDGGVTIIGTAAEGLGRLALVGPDVTTDLHDITVGQAGVGTLSLENQVQINLDGALVIAAEPDSRGEVITDEGAITADRIVVGGPEGGQATLTVAEADVVVTDVLVVGPEGQIEGSVIDLGGPTRQKGRQTGIRTTTLSLAAGGMLAVQDVVFGSDWTLGGSGSLPFPVVNDASVAPGDPGQPGILTIDGDYTQAPTGRLRVDLFAGGPTAQAGELDQLWITGAVALAGTLMVHVDPDAEAEVGDRFRIVTGTSCTGAFDAVVADPVVEVAVEYDATGADLVVTGLPVAVDDDTMAPAAFALSPVAPNPFNPRAEVALALPRTQQVAVRVVDLRGRVIATLHEGELAGGRRHVFTLDGTRWPSGVYLVHAAGEDVTATRKFVLVE
ncbi:T9SS type A sorting domain-containing protein, partial [bacterium]|nr:T9SS type A sorting domain-containing protein [bacterium]